MASTRSQGVVTLVAVVATGAWEEVRPYAALALGLVRAGFAVKFVSHGPVCERATALGLRCVPLRGDPGALYRSVAFRDGITSGSHLALANLLQADARATVALNLPVLASSLKDVDALVVGVGVLTECTAIAQRYQIPLVVCPTLPFSPTGELAVGTLIAEPFRSPWMNRLTWQLSGMLTWALMGATYNEFRTKTLGIGPQSGFVIDGLPQVASFSSVAVPRPADWGANVYTTGAWHLPPDVDRPKEGQRVLAALMATPSTDVHLRPILVTFGAVPVADPVTFLRSLYTLAQGWSVPVVFAAAATDVAAARTSPRLEGLTGMLFELYDAPTSADADVAVLVAQLRVLVVSDVPLSWIVPRCSIVIHEGSSAMTQAVLEAGIPSAAFPAFGEQYFWAARISSMGAGPILYFPMRQVLEKLDECVIICRQDAVRAKAAEIGEAIRALGDGVQIACAAIRATFSRAQNRHCGIVCQWVPDESQSECSFCNLPFTLTNRRRHCRSCGALGCYACLGMRCHLPGYPENAPQITCERCIDTRRAFFAMFVGRSVVPGPVEGAASSSTFVTVAAASPPGPSGAASSASAARAFGTPVLTGMSSSADGQSRESVLRGDLDGFIGAAALPVSAAVAPRSLQSAFAAADGSPDSGVVMRKIESFRSPDGKVEAMPL